MYSTAAFHPHTLLYPHMSFYFGCILYGYLAICRLYACCCNSIRLFQFLNHWLLFSSLANSLNIHSNYTTCYFSNCFCLCTSLSSVLAILPTNLIFLFQISTILWKLQFILRLFTACKCVYLHKFETTC